MSFEEFLDIESKSDKSIEFIDGGIYLQASPNTSHQRISRKISTIFDVYFSDKKCEPFTAPYDIILKSDKKTSKNKVIPDLSVICDESGINEKNYSGVPTLIVEILSPSTAWIDISKKLELYQSFGVKEYWIISPKNSNVQIFNLNEENFYDEPIVYYKDDIAKSSIFNNLNVNLKEIFK
ncbi:MAG: Uma2 family endonuclease [Clostridium sp.]|uniref:Uma2 family endonuclease n=1 Tax=Clostridium sp. TaxID=1506 RepID=UPI0025C1C77B|nr:Uma2 family endonuclease [Clostridium sp.]MCH3964407.1 Uma2 family endonuclease [Clostridium sp.]MCI1870439.1 Uma2 family endonuclease [Clostridium sp.]